MEYPVPAGCHRIAAHLLDLRSDAEIDQEITSLKPVQDEKNVWMFWHSGFPTMHSYLQRNVRAWHRRFSKQGWVIRVLDRIPGSSLNVANFLDVKCPGTFPRSFIDGTIGGDHAPQHTSDLVRFPLLLKYGGLYADTGLIQIGDLDGLWNRTIADPTSPIEVLTYTMGGAALTNYFMACQKGCRFFEFCQRLLLHLWSTGGGRTSTEGMHEDPLLSTIPLLMEGNSMSFTEGDKTYESEEISRMLSDYIIQGQVMSLVLGLVDEEYDWNGPEYAATHVYAFDFMVGSQLINEFTDWNGEHAFQLMSLSIPKQGETENTEQKLAREIVQGCLSRSFAFKLAHGLIVRVLGETLGSLWRKHKDSDNVPGTYAHWLRHGAVYFEPDELPARSEICIEKPFKRGPLLRET